MKSEGQQTDFVDIQRLARAHYVASEAALHNPYFDEQERRERAEFYRKQAERLEAML
jgi:hypothetical protein